jgi:ATP-dependent Clp protease ATP-binding subunit ClpC
MVGRGKKPPSGHIPFTPRAKNAMELSLREAQQLSDNFISTEHILLGLLREGQGVAVQALVAMGVDLRGVRREVLQLAGQQSGPRDVRVATPVDAAEAAALQEMRLPLRVWMNSVGKSLSDIVDRLNAIERHLGLEGSEPGDGPGDEGSKGEASGE